METRLITRLMGELVLDENPNFSVFSAAMHSRRNCRRCHTRGHQTFHLANGVREIRTCLCVERRIRQLEEQKTELVYKTSTPNAVTRHYCNSFTKTWTKTVRDN